MTAEQTSASDERMLDAPVDRPTGSGVPERMTLRQRSRGIVAQLVKFALVGGVGFVIDFGVFNLLCLTVLAPAQVHEGPIVAKLISTTLAIAANWIGNRYWTFGPHRRNDSAKEALEFLVVSLAGMGVGLLCLWVSRYVLGFTTLLADNISSNVIGLILGSLLRFALYRHWVYHPARAGRSS